VTTIDQARVETFLGQALVEPRARSGSPAGVAEASDGRTDERSGGHGGRLPGWLSQRRRPPGGLVRAARRFDLVWNRQLTRVWQLWCACWSHGPIREAVLNRGD
jgi:hypothetical protein